MEVTGERGTPPSAALLAEEEGALEAEAPPCPALVTGEAPGKIEKEKKICPWFAAVDSLRHVLAVTAHAQLAAHTYRGRPYTVVSQTYRVFPCGSLCMIA